MLDMTNNKQEKETFIVGLMLNLKQNKCIVKYANGKEEQQPFSIEEYNKKLLLMEKQFLFFKNSYIEKTKKEKIKLSIAQLVEIMVAITGVAITCSLNMMYEAQAFIIILISILSVCFQGEISNEIDMRNYNLYTTNIVDEFIKRKEEFKIDIIDEKTNEKAEWYVINLANIWQISSINDLDRVSHQKTNSATTQKLVKKLNKTLNKNYIQI